MPKIQVPKLGRPGGATRNRHSGRKPPPEEPVSRELIAERDRLLEKFTVMQTDLGGAFYEMAIRDHVKLEVQTRKATKLQRVDLKLGQVEEALERTGSKATGECASC